MGVHLFWWLKSTAKNQCRNGRTNLFSSPKHYHQGPCASLITSWFSISLIIDRTSSCWCSGSILHVDLTFDFVGSSNVSIPCGNYVPIATSSSPNFRCSDWVRPSTLYFILAIVSAMLEEGSSCWVAPFILVSNRMNLASLLSRLEESQHFGFMNYNGSKCWVKYLYSNETISIHGQWLGNIQAMPVNKFRLRFHHAHAIIHFLGRELCFQPHLISCWYSDCITECNMVCHCLSLLPCISIAVIFSLHQLTWHVVANIMQPWLVKKSLTSRYSCIKLSATSTGCWTQVFPICTETVASPRRAIFDFTIGGNHWLLGLSQTGEVGGVTWFQRISMENGYTANLVSTNIDRDGHWQSR